MFRTNVTDNIAGRVTVMMYFAIHRVPRLTRSHA